MAGFRSLSRKIKNMHSEKRSLRENPRRLQKCPFYAVFYLELASFCSLFDAYCNSHSHTNHRVVSCTDQTHHLNVSRYG